MVADIEHSPPFLKSLDPPLLLPFRFRYASFYHKNEHKNLLELIIYSIEALIISEFC